MSGQNTYRQPWLHTALFDGLYLLFPGLAALIITCLLPAEYKTTDKMPLAGWIVLVLLVDVAHVYSTLFRTYLDKDRFQKHKVLYVAIPIACYVVGVLLYSADALYFWRILAYLAVYHFIRQQYGFMRLYSRQEPKDNLSAKIDVAAIYAATLYPLIYWHCTPGRNFNWFVDGDFVQGDMAFVKQAAWYVYLLIIATYLIKEAVSIAQQGHLNIPRNLVVIITFLSWYFGIVYFNGDMAFTLLNVVAHGIPYIALIWLFKEEENKQNGEVITTGKFPYATLAFFLLVIVGLAYLEEGVWDGMVWHEHKELFRMFQWLPSPGTKEVMALLVPLLSLPQSTHYVLDGFIWKKGGH